MEGTIAAAYRQKHGFQERGIKMLAVKMERPRVIEIESERSPAREIPVLSGSVYERWKGSEEARRSLLRISLNELRAPLTVIKGCADALQYGFMGELNDLQVKKVGIIVDRTDKMARIIETADWGFSVLEEVEGDFVSVLSQELRGPLAVIKGYADALQYGDLGKVTDLQARKIGIINDCADLITEIVDGFISADRLSEGLLQDGIWPDPSREELDRMIYEVERV
jgi:signal transduction histidine kinase